MKLIWVVSNRCSGLDFRLRLCCRHWIVVAAWTRLVVPVGFSDDFPINEERRKKVFQGGLSFCWVKAGEVAKRAALVCFKRSRAHKSPAFFVFVVVFVVAVVVVVVVVVVVIACKQASWSGSTKRSRRARELVHGLLFSVAHSTIDHTRKWKVCEQTGAAGAYSASTECIFLKRKTPSENKLEVSPKISPLKSFLHKDKPKAYRKSVIVS